MGGSNCPGREEDNKKFGCEEAKPNNVPVAAECRGVGVCKTNNLNGAFQHAGRHAEGSWDIQAWTFERRGCEGESKAKEETREQEEEQQRKGACEQIREEGEEGDDDQDGGVEQPRLEDGSASAQSSSCKGILVYCVPHVF